MQNRPVVQNGRRKVTCPEKRFHAIHLLQYGSAARAGNSPSKLRTRDDAHDGRSRRGGNSAGLLARISFTPEESGTSGNRLFVNDLNGPLYILDETRRKATTYLDCSPGKLSLIEEDLTFARIARSAGGSAGRDLKASRSQRLLELR